MKELKELGEIAFPVRGIERFEKINQLIHPYKAEINSITERIENLKKELAAIQPDQAFLENESAILSLLDQVPLYRTIEIRKNCNVK